MGRPIYWAIFTWTLSRTSSVDGCWCSGSTAVDGPELEWVTFLWSNPTRPSRDRPM